MSFDEYLTATIRTHWQLIFTNHLSSTLNNSRLFVSEHSPGSQGSPEDLSYADAIASVIIKVIVAIGQSIPMVKCYRLLFAGCRFQVRTFIDTKFEIEQLP